MTFHRLNTLARDRGPLDLLKAPNYYLPNFLEAVIRISVDTTPTQAIHVCVEIPGQPRNA